MARDSNTGLLRGRSRSLICNGPSLPSNEDNIKDLKENTHPSSNRLLKWLIIFTVI
ncbi:hypothetical protein SK128_015172 [Halocaridina rubra]|uniref:Uncharacterized protein n=1 Tax=Halocaridina rubra TaxID=373956 RepID=A0AAN8X956_HALRR